MICPSCNSPADVQFNFCIRCGFGLAKHGPLVANLRRSATWILRRSMAGMTTGLVGWFIIPIAARWAGPGLEQWGHLLLSGALGGYFLGIVEGMVEDSTVKTVRGGLLGAIGGLVGGVIGNLALASADSGMTAVVLAWGTTGGIIGASSVWLEKRAPRILMGFAAGFIGGALGGWLGYQMYASLAEMAKPEAWLYKRGIEAITGAVLGAVLWFSIGITEKLWIFRRRIATNISYKECDRCEHINILKAWYCAECGALLQVAAPAEKMQWTRREALARVIAACTFVGQLSAMTGAAIAVLVMFFLGPINFFLALFGLLATCLVTYFTYTAFFALSDTLTSFLDSSDRQPPRSTTSTL